MRDLGAISNLDLGNGTELKAGANSIEAKLLNFIKNGTIDENDKTKNWISFDRLQFETGKSTLTAKSEEQLKNIVDILKAFPNVHIKLGGYTDNKGADADNLKLSDERAHNVKSKLEAMGIAASRMEAEGYGSKHPVANNDTDLGRAQNRRIDIKVTKK